MSTLKQIISPRNLLFGYIGLVVIFSFAYWLVWLWQPDYFIVNEQINKLPLKMIKDTLQSSDKDIDIHIDSTRLDIANDFVTKQVVHLRAISKCMAVLQEEREAQENDFTTILSNVNKARRQNIDEYKKRLIVPILLKQKEAIERVQLWESIAEKESNILAKSQWLLRISTAKVELADINVELAVKKYEIADYVVRNYGEFLSPESSAILQRMNDRILRLESEIPLIAKTYGDARSDFYRAWGKFYGPRVKKLSWIDFAYFSIITASTTGYGDIVPNHVITRALVAMQIVICMSIFALFIARIIQLWPGRPK